MTLLTLDIGGTSVKYGLWENGDLAKVNSFKTPGTWEEMKKTIKGVLVAFQQENDITGIAISAPGAVDQENRVIKGASAVPYLHDFPIYDELEKELGFPVALENDANSAALAEIWKGAAQGLRNVLFVVIGSGVGGAVIVDGKVQHGKHLFGGEFGFNLLSDTETFSQLATAVSMARRYAARKGLSPEDVSGEKVFLLAEEGDEVAREETEKFYFQLAKGIYNLQYSFDPELILIGGGVSNKADLLEKLDEQFDKILNIVQIAPFKPEVKTCEFKSNANLIGAVYNYYQKHEEKQGG